MEKIQNNNRTWTESEIKYLREAWGFVSIDSICRHLGRSKNAIMVLKDRLKLGPFLINGEYVTMHQLVIALGYSSGADGYKVKSWIENRGFPVHIKTRSNKAKIRVVYLDEFWKWAEKNRSFIDFGRMEPLALGAEPEWVSEQRRKDFLGYSLQRKDPWTPDEDARLKMLLSKYQYGYAELSEMLHRSTGAIQRRCSDLGLKARPLKANNHGEDCAWTDAQYKILADGIKHGDGYMAISKAIGKSEKAVRGKVYNEYFTENADKVREMIGNGNWGDGRPVPTVRQARRNSRYRTEIAHNIEQIAGILKFKVDQAHAELLKNDPFFQKGMCMKWDGFNGCTAGCDNCDECNEFVRIRPQYCCRCGGTFIERADNKLCPACRVARKKQAQRKWAALHNR